MFSEALRILDQNTVKYMIDEYQKELADKTAQLTEQSAQLTEQMTQLAEKDAAILEKDAEIRRLRQLLNHQSDS